jgi:hypothetical protein
MTPKEKAIDLVENHKMQCRECGGKETAKIHALITVDEIIDQFNYIVFIDDRYRETNLIYWQEVKKEIENL